MLTNFPCFFVCLPPLSCVVQPHKKKEVHFLIMGSVFFTNKFVHTVFDLKGSRQGRNATQKEKDSGAAVYKDNDFVDMGITIKLGEERAKLLNEQIARDVEYLRKLNIMDYSLLLGIHYKDRAGEVYGPGAAGAGPASNPASPTAHQPHMNGSSSQQAQPLGGAAAGGAGAAVSAQDYNARREGLAGVTGDDLAAGGAEAGEYQRVRVADFHDTHGAHALTPPMEEPAPLAAAIAGGNDDNVFTQMQPHTVAGRVDGVESSHLEPHSQQRPFLDSELGFGTPTHNKTAPVAQSPSVGQQANPLAAVPALALPSSPVPTIAATPAVATVIPAAAIAADSPAVVVATSTPTKRPNAHALTVDTAITIPEGSSDEDEEDSMTVHFHDAQSPRSGISSPRETGSPRIIESPRTAAAAAAAAAVSPPSEPSSPTTNGAASSSSAAAAPAAGFLLAPPSLPPLARDSLEIHPTPSTPQRGSGNSLTLKTGFTNGHGNGTHTPTTFTTDNGPFSSRAWTTAGGARSNRSQSVVGGLPAHAHSPTTAAQQAATDARTKKEVAAAAKLDAIAKQTAYGLPKKYNKVSNPRDIAFPFEFELAGEGLLHGATSVGVMGSLPNSPQQFPAYHAATTTVATATTTAATNSPRVGAAALPGPATPFGSLGSPAAQKAAAAGTVSGGRRTNEHTPVLKAATTPSQPLPSSPQPPHDDVHTLEPLPPAVVTPTVGVTLTFPATTNGHAHGSGNVSGNSSPVPPSPRQGRAMSVFASSKEADVYAQRRSNSGTYQNSIPARSSFLLASSTTPILEANSSTVAAEPSSPFTLQLSPTVRDSDDAVLDPSAPTASASSSASSSSSSAPVASFPAVAVTVDPAHPPIPLESSSRNSPVVGAQPSAAGGHVPALHASEIAMLTPSAHTATTVAGSSPRRGTRVLLPALLPQELAAIGAPVAVAAAAAHPEVAASAAPAAAAATPAVAAAAAAASSSHPTDEHKSSPAVAAAPVAAAAAATSAAAASTASSSSSSSSSHPPLQPGQLPDGPPLLHPTPSMAVDKLALFATDGGCAGQNPDGTPNNEVSQAKRASERTREATRFPSALALCSLTPSSSPVTHWRC